MSGVVFTPAAADRIGRATRWVEAQRQAGREPAGPGRGVEPVWARVTSGTADGDGYYPGVITLRAGDDGSWSDYSAVKVGPLNGETLTNATRYAVRPSGRTSAGDELYTVIGTTVAAGTIEVEAADGTPAYAGVTKVTFDQADGFSLSQPLGGVVAVDLLPATESQAGIVSTEGQRFGGHKTFADGVTAIDEVFVDEEEGAGEGGAGRLWLKLYRTMPGGSYGTATGSEGIVGLWESGMGAGGYPATYPCLRFIRPVLGDPGGLYKLMVHAPDRLHLHCQEIQINALGGGGDETGQTGTLTGGAVVTCGIVTDLGDGVIDGGTW